MKTFPKPLTAAEEKECLERVKAGDRAARDMLIERNMRLVAHVVKKYQGTDYDMDDLLSVGTIGLIKAVNTFKMDRGSRLATYAVKCVENAILSQRLFRRRRLFLTPQRTGFPVLRIPRRSFRDGFRQCFWQWQAPDRSPFFRFETYRSGRTGQK